MNVLVLTTGGTIDSAPYPETGEIPPDIIPAETRSSIETLRRIAAAQEPEILLDWVELCNKDSKYLDPQDLVALEHAIISKAHSYDRVLITMGTDCMTSLAQDLKARLGEVPDCPVVFTGSIMPLSNGEMSDGHANLRLALLGNPAAEPGIYIAMHGLFAPCEQVRKDFEKRRFVYK